MRLEEIKNKTQWERLAENFPERTFLHSWSWGEFQSELGFKVWRLGLFKKDDCLALAQVIKLPIVRQLNWSFFYIPHGPLLQTEDRLRLLQFILNPLVKLAQQEQVSFLRVGPVLENSRQNRELFHRLGFKKAPLHIHTENSWRLDLRAPEEELFQGMRKGHRYSIRQALQAGVKIMVTQQVNSGSYQQLQDFNKLYQALAQRVRFSPFGWQYLKKEFEIFARLNQAKLFTAWHQNKMIAGALIIFYGEQAFYHHGASVFPAKLPATHLLLWEAIKEARSQGKRFFNFWGVAPQNAPPDHPWQGLSFFKQGFGGEYFEFVPTQDFPFQSSYYLNRLIETFRRRRRNL